MTRKQPATPVSHRRSGQFAASLACVLSLLAYSASAQATTDEERAGAREAATAGAEAFDAGRYQEALVYFQKAESLVHALPHLLFTARAHERLGQLVAARETYLKITREDLAPTAPKAFRDARDTARNELAALEPRVPRVSIVVQGAGDLPVRVQMNGQDVPAGLVGVPRPLDPGNYQFQAFAQGAQSTPTSLSLREGAKETVVLTLRGDLGDGSTAPGTTTAPLAAGAPPPAEAPASSSGSGSGLRIGGFIGIGVGVAGVVTGTIFALRSKSKRDEANDICSQQGMYACPESQRDHVNELDSQADSARTGAIVGFVVGGVGLATGATLLVLSSSASKTGARITPWIGWQSAGVSGRF
ncbi:MAG: hypothetical protein ACOY0T_32860 [Myxococcota bacterium]